MGRRFFYHGQYQRRQHPIPHQQIWNECSRLITNCIIYYNVFLLSKLYEIKREQGDTSVAQQLARISPVAWQHINFHGRYEFTKAPQSIDLEALVMEIAARLLAPLDISN